MSAAEALSMAEATGARLATVERGLRISYRGPKDAVAQAIRIIYQTGSAQGVIEMLRTREAFGWNVPPDPCEGPGLERYEEIAHLRAFCLQEGVALARAWQSIIPIPEAPLTPSRVQALAVVLDGLDVVADSLADHLDAFHEIGPLRAQIIIRQLVMHHQAEGFRVRGRGLNGVDVPKAWGLGLRLAIQSIYSLSVQEV
jgi:hypothetical protein